MSPVSVYSKSTVSQCHFQYDTTKRWSILEAPLNQNTKIINFTSIRLIYSYCASYSVISIPKVLHYVRL